MELKLLIIAVSLLFSDVYSQITPGATTENVIVTVKNNFKPEEVVTALNRDNQSEHVNYSDKPSTLLNYARTARAKSTTSSVELFTCAISLDAPCLMDHVENIVDNANDNLLEQADAEARKISVGRADSEEDAAPSSLIASIAQMLLELPEVLKDSLGGMFRSDAAGVLDIQDSSNSESDEGDEDDEEDNETEGNEDEETTEEDEEKESDSTDDEDQKAKVESKDYGDEFDGFVRKKCGKKKGCSNGMGNSGGGGDYFHFVHGTATGSEVGDGRGKKKKKKKAIVKLLLLGLIIKAKITLLLKLLAAKLQIKFLLIAAANLLLNLARFWWDLKKGSHHEQPQKVIYYEHAQHQHHYDGGDEWQSSPGGGGGYWGRAYETGDEKDHKSAQDLAYSKQLPKGTTYTRVDDKPNISWNPFG